MLFYTFFQPPFLLDYIIHKDKREWREFINLLFKIGKLPLKLSEIASVLLREKENHNGVERNPEGVNIFVVG